MAEKGKNKDFKWSCWRKKKFISQEGADRAAESYERVFGKPMKAYPCRHCNYYHIGHRHPEVVASIETGKEYEQ